MSIETIHTLEIVIAGTDNEKKVLTLNAFREELESLDTPPDLHRLIPSLKASLDSSNGHVTYAALTCLPPLTRSHASPAHQSALKQLVLSLYSPTSGSVVSFLGDAKQRTREVARDALLAAASAACEAHLKSQTPARTDEVLQELERIIKEQGFANKTARAREQSLHYLSEIRSRYPTLVPFKTYLPSLVSLLEDSDVSVRTAASTAITTVFSDPSLPASARGDLKNELTKQGTRRSTVDAILAKVFSNPNPSSNDTSAHLGSSTDDPPPTPTDQGGRDQAIGSQIDPLASSQSGPPNSDSQSSAIIHPVFVSGPRELESIFAKMLPHWEGKETEHNWQAREANCTTLRGMIKTNVHLQYTAEFVNGLKSISDGLLKSLASLRTTIAVGACNAFFELSVLGSALDPVVDTILPPLLRMAAQTKKMVFQASQAAVSALIKSTYHPRVFQYLSACINEKTVQARIAGISRLKEFLDTHAQSSKTHIESGGGLSLIEKVLRRSLADASPQVRETAREVFWNCSAIWPSMTTTLIETLDGPTRKQLQKACTGQRSTSSILFKPEKEPASRVSVRSLIKSTRSAKQVVEKPNEVQPIPVSPRRVHSSVAPVEPSTKTIGMPLSQSHYNPDHQRPNSRAQSAPKTVLQRSMSAFDSSTPDQTKSLLSSPPLRLSASKTPSPRRTVPSPSLSRIAVRSASVGKNRSGLNSTPPSRKVLSAENIVEDAMKAQAEQAESTAHRLLELTEDENEPQSLIPIGPGEALLPPVPQMNDLPVEVKPLVDQPQAMKQAQPAINKELIRKQFENSPRYSCRSMAEEVPNKKELGHHSSKNVWWHRQAQLSMCAARTNMTPDDIIKMIEQLEQNKPSPELRQIYLDLSQLCFEQRCTNKKINNNSDDNSVMLEEKLQMDTNLDFWTDNNTFDRLFESLKEHIKQDASVEVKDAQLVLLRALILYENMLMAGKETELCELLLLVASEGIPNSIIAVEALGSLWASTSDPVYGLSCLRSCVEIVSQQRTSSSIIGDDRNSFSNHHPHHQVGVENWMGLAMSCLAVFFSRLPAEIVEEELPKASELIKKALNHRQVEIRMSAITSLVSANKVINNDREILQVLGNLTTAQEALITYYLTPRR